LNVSSVGSRKLHSFTSKTKAKIKKFVEVFALIRLRCAEPDNMQLYRDSSQCHSSFLHNRKTTRNFMAHLLFIREISGANLGPEIGYLLVGDL
jgi:hypothetical protein